MGERDPGPEAKDAGWGELRAPPLPPRHGSEHGSPETAMVRMARTFRNTDIFRGVPEKTQGGGGRKQGELRCVTVPS